MKGQMYFVKKNVIFYTMTSCQTVKNWQLDTKICVEVALDIRNLCCENECRQSLPSGSKLMDIL